MKRFSTLMMALLISAGAFAAEYKGSADIQYKGRLDKIERSEAVEEAKKNAIERWIVNERPKDGKNYYRVKHEIDEHIDRYVLDSTIVAEDTDKKRKIFSATVRVEINEILLEDKLLEKSERETAGQNKYLSFVFVAREHSGTTSQSAERETIERGKKETISRERSANSATQGKSQANSVGRSSERYDPKAEVIWKVSTANEIDAAMGDVFTDAAYNVIDAGILEEEAGHAFSVQQFIEEYGRGQDISKATLSDTIVGLRALQDPIHYLARGTLDVDEQSVDPATGNVRVAVIMTGEVIDIHNRGSAVAKVGPEVRYGEGTTFLVAKNNALSVAAEEVAKQLVGKLSARNIR